jgi:uncharacterized protein (UPF0335 family)
VRRRSSARRDPRQQEEAQAVTIAQGTLSADKLIAYVERLEHLLDEIEGLKDDLKDLKAQARDEGFNVAALMRLVAIRRNKHRASMENELLNDLVLYAHRVGAPLDIAFIDLDWDAGGGKAADGVVTAAAEPEAAGDSAAEGAQRDE